MNIGNILFMIVQIRVSVGFFPELDYDAEDGTLEGIRYLEALPSLSFLLPEYMNALEQVDHHQGHADRHTNGNIEAEGTQMIVRLKKMLS